MLDVECSLMPQMSATATIPKPREQVALGGTTTFLAGLTATQNGTSPIAGAATLESIFRAAPAGICVVTNGVFTHVNSRLCEMTGYSREELIGCSEKILFATESDLERLRSNHLEDISLGQSRKIETRWKCKDG